MRHAYTGRRVLATGWVQLAEALQRCLPRRTAEARAASAYHPFEAAGRSRAPLRASLASLGSTGTRTPGSLPPSTVAPSLPPPSKDYVARRAWLADRGATLPPRVRKSFSDRESSRSPLSFRTPWWSRGEEPPFAGQASPPQMSPLRLDFLHPMPPEPTSQKKRRINWLWAKRDGKSRGDRSSAPAELGGDERAALQIQRITRGKHARARRHTRTRPR